jgi:hypothetical protein
MFREYEDGIYVIDHDYAEIWVAKNLAQQDVDYYYGGTRTVPFTFTRRQTFEAIKYLETFESGLKNELINRAIREEVFDGYASVLPVGFLDSSVGGGRCVIRPKSAQVEAALTDVEHRDHEATVEALFADLGRFLDLHEGSIKLTPDFGKFAGLADMLHKYTESVLGIACDEGGCGGKASYTSTGIIQALGTLGFEERKREPVTLIGANGACGSVVLDYILEGGFSDVAVCDIAYDRSPELLAPLRARGMKHLVGERGKFTDECLSRGGLIVATTVGHELMRSNVSVLKDGTVFLLAHNEVIPSTPEGMAFVDRIVGDRQVLLVPGQLLTFGGALTSRIEWFWRQDRAGEFFDKALAHEMVKVASDYWIRRMPRESDSGNTFKALYGMVDRGAL